MSKFKIGDKVRYIGEDHRGMPEFYPEIGTIGTVVKESGDTDWYIQWPKGSTTREDCWYCDENDIELVVDEKKTIDTHMSNEEIWKMLRAKMEKNSLKSVGTIVHNSTDKDCSKIKFTRVYAEDDVHNAIALAYKVGYLRSQKGRPFKFGEKKKKGGHWEPVDPNNLPKEGTRVRYSREYKGYNWLKDSLCIGTKGTLTIDGPYSRIGMMLDRPTSFLAWADFEDEEAIACLDMWVEDDE